jgi:hypothetical protein
MRRTLLALGTALLTVVPATAVGAPRVTTLFTVQDPEITESSGLVDQGSDVLTIEDSGDGPTIYVLDSATGQTVGRTTYSTDAVVDVEAVARGRNGVVWVGDIGDNDAVRPNISVYRVGRVGPGDTTVSAQRYDLVYPGGPRDAETLLVDPDDGRLYVVSKGLFSGQLFRAPRTLSADEANVLRPVGRVGGLVTDGEFMPDGDHVVLRDYSEAFVYATGPWRSLGSWMLPSQPQGEGISVRPSAKRVIVSSEGDQQPVLSIRIPSRLVDAMRPREASPSGSGPSGDRAAAAASASSGSSSPDIIGVVGLAAVGLAAALGLRAVVRRTPFRSSRPRSRSTR